MPNQNQLKDEITVFEIEALQRAFTEALKAVGLDRLDRQIEGLKGKNSRSPAQDKLLEKLNEDRRSLSFLVRFRAGPQIPEISFAETIEEARRATEITNSLLISDGLEFLAAPEDFFPGAGLEAFFKDLDSARIFAENLKFRLEQLIGDPLSLPRLPPGMDQFETPPLEFDPEPTPLEPLEIDPRLKKEDEEASIAGDGIVRMAGLDQVLVGAGQAFDGLDATLEKVDKSMTTVFDNMAVGGARAADELSRIFASLDSDILGSLGGLGSIISQFFGGGPLKLLGSLFGLAGGGAVQPGIPILVGERGPEIFLPGGPGRVLNGHDSQRAMGGAMGGGPRQLVVQQTINFSTDVKNTVRAEVLNALPLATNIAGQKVSDMLRGIRY